MSIIIIRNVMSLEFPKSHGIFVECTKYCEDLSIAVATRTNNTV